MISGKKNFDTPGSNVPDRVNGEITVPMGRKQWSMLFVGSLILVLKLTKSHSLYYYCEVAIVNSVIENTSSCRLFSLFCPVDIILKIT